MIHIDRNHLSSTNLISDKIVSWSHPEKQFDTFIADSPVESAPLGSDPSLPRPVAPDSPSAPSPADANTASPTRDRSSSLSPAPETGSAVDSPAVTDEKEGDAPVEAARQEEEEDEEVRVEQASRQSTPLSELSPPPPDDDNEEPAKAEEEEVKAPEEPTPEPAPKPERTPSIGSPATPTPSSDPTKPTNDPKVVSILELNLELLKICIEFQTRGLPMSEPRFSQYSVRLQSNLTWLAAAADHSRVGNHSNMLLPTMDPPPPVEFGNMDRIQQIYTDLPSIFAKEIARRHQMGVIPTLAPPMMSASNGGTLKRDRPEEVGGDTAMKRRNTGEMKPPPSSMPMPPPSTIPNLTQNQNHPHHHPTPIPHPPSAAQPFPLPTPHASSPPQPSESQMAPLNPSLHPNTSTTTADAQLAASNRERARQAQIRAAQQQAARQMSPSAGVPNAAAGPSSMGGGGGGGMVGGGGMGGGSGGGVDQGAQHQLFRILQTPGHPFVQYMVRTVPGFEGMGVGVQMQKMLMTQANLQRQQQAQAQAQQNAGMSGMPPGHMKNPMQGQQMSPQGGTSSSHHPFSLGGPNNPNPASPIPPQSQSQQFGMEGAGQSVGGGGGGGMDPRVGIPPGFNINNLTPHQRQQLILMQQSRQAGGANAAGGQMASPPNSMMMNAQQQQHQQQQQQQQHQQQQQMAFAQEQQNRMREQYSSSSSNNNSGWGCKAPPRIPLPQCQGRARGAGGSRRR
ncbi:hypothetical protein FPV67DRAFT_1776494 [Lyophyllum atratum]|nr:hypothetical protein FPV67DRAFT_1776494 [Lyophyllum atratum]